MQQAWFARSHAAVHPAGTNGVNKSIAERLFLKTYELELEQAKGYRVWAYRKAAWTVDEWTASVAELHRTRGKKGLRELPNVGKRLSAKISEWLEESR